MKDYSFRKGSELLELCAREKCGISEIMLLREAEENAHSREEILAEMQKNLDTMRTSVNDGLRGDLKSISGLSGGDAAKLISWAEKVDALSGSGMLKAAAASMAVVEVNASMGRIVAAPTAGASGILPGTLLTCGEAKGWDDEAMIRGLFNAGAVGMLIARNATISGAEGGCQAETGAAAAMAASALTELSGGSPEQCLNAAASALKNVMGLVCDPVAGLVECPCIKRNAIGAANALVSADLALAGIRNLIPFDEVVMAMKSVGRLMSPDLRETAKGGLAATPTAKAISKQLEE